MDTSHIISGAELKRYQRARRWWWAGWAVALVVSLAGAYLAGERRAYARARTELDARLAEVRAVEANQTKATQSLVHAWTELNTTAETVAMWGQNNAAKQEMIDLNRGMVRSKR